MYTLVIAWRLGVTTPEEWSELGEVVNGKRPGRLADEEITVGIVHPTDATTP